MKTRVLFVTSNGCSKESIEKWLVHVDADVVNADNHEELVKRLSANNYVVCVLRSDELDDSRLDLIQLIRAKSTSARIIISVGSATVEEAVRYIRAGAADFLVGDLLDARLAHAIRRLVPKTITEGRGAGDSENNDAGDGELLLGNNPKVQEVLAAISLVARSATAVLITGESGTGKDLVARMIHRQSERASKPFVALNAAAIPKDLIESELFGHERGAFTGAMGKREGCFELANGGTIFFDEIAEMNPDTQAKLLRAIEHQSFRRVGGKEEIIVDVRAIAATNKPIYDAMKAGEFREDLYYRFSVIEIHLPPLRERRDDIPVLLDHFLLKFGNQYNRQFTQQFSNDALELLMEYDWPGNVRELRNVVERAAVICPHSVIGQRYLPKLIAKQKESRSYITIPLGSSAQEAERKLILETLLAVNHNKSKAARILGLSRKTLHNKLAEFRVEDSSSEEETDSHVGAELQENPRRRKLPSISGR